jgi:hypothetical protein
MQLLPKHAAFRLREDIPTGHMTMQHFQRREDISTGHMTVQTSASLFYLLLAGKPNMFFYWLLSIYLFIY